MADLQFVIVRKSGKKAEGVLDWPDKGLRTIAVSGPYGGGALPIGTYEAQRAILLDKPGEPPYTDKKGRGWMQAFTEPNFSNRTGLGIHPDGSVFGTEGCIGIEPSDTKPWYDAFYASGPRLSLEVKNAPAAVIESSEDDPRAPAAFARRPLDDDEKASARSWWPNMNVDAVVVSAGKTAAYNCLAWTLGITTTWVWPWNPQGRKVTKAEFDALYHRYQFNPATSGEVSAFGFSTSDMQHGAISGAGHGPRWESKAGAWLRIQHGLGEMEGGIYGDVEGFYIKKAVAGLRPIPTLVELFAIQMELTPNDGEVAALRAAAAGVPRELREAFDRAYAAWRRTWDDPTIIASSNPAMRTENREFRELISLPRAVLPLLVEKLLDPEEFFGLLAAERMTRPSPSAVFDIEDERLFTGEQGRALLFARRWIALNL